MSVLNEQMAKLRALVKGGVPFEDAYAQCLKELREQEQESKPTRLNNGMVGNSAQAKINAAKRWGNKK